MYIDTKSNRLIQYLLAGASFTYAIQILINAIFNTVMGISITESFSILLRCNLRTDYRFQLHEAGFTVKTFFGILIFLVNISIIGIVIRKYLFTVSLPERVKSKIMPFMVILFAILFVGEQALSSRDIRYYSRRELPSYLELFRTNSYSYTIQLPSDNLDNRVTLALKHLGRPENPKNIVFIVLESFRHDMIDKSICPTIYEMSNNSLMIENAYSDALYTSLSWNVLFLDAPPYSIRSDIESPERQKNGSKILRILKKAGYTTHLFISANFQWNHFFRRFSQNGALLDSYYLTYTEHMDKQRNELDRITATRAIECIKAQKKSSKPFIIFLQFDSSHFTYFFDKDAEVLKRYPQIIGINEVREKQHIGHLFNRYKNSARNVDNRIGDVIAALKENGFYDNTCIAIVSDHGEGFAPGRIGHHVFHDEIKRIAMLLHLPGIRAKRITMPASQMNLFPTIFDYLKIPGLDPSLFLGSSLLSPHYTRHAILTFHGSELTAELNSFTTFLYFRTNIQSNSITFTPYRALNSSGNCVDINSEWKSEDWKKKIRDEIKIGH